MNTGTQPGYKRSVSPETRELRTNKCLFDSNKFKPHSELLVKLSVSSAMSGLCDGTATLNNEFSKLDNGAAALLGFFSFGILRGLDFETFIKDVLHATTDEVAILLGFKGMTDPQYHREVSLLSSYRCIYRAMYAERISEYLLVLQKSYEATSVVRGANLDSLATTNFYSASYAVIQDICNGDSALPPFKTVLQNILKDYRSRVISNCTLCPMTLSKATQELASGAVEDIVLRGWQEALSYLVKNNLRCNIEVTRRYKELSLTETLEAIYNSNTN